MSKVDLRLDWVGHDAAKFAVEHWHYSRTMPVGKTVRIGVWEDGQFIGVVLFGRGATPNIGSPYGISQVECCELVRIALRQHQSPVSRIMAIAVRMLKTTSPELRLVVSFADPEQGHAGGIYQACNWIYTGRGASDYRYFHEGEWKHSREIRGGAFGKTRKVTDYSNLPKRLSVGKHKYLYPLDDDMRQQIEPLRKPYPKREPANEAT